MQETCLSQCKDDVLDKTTHLLQMYKTTYSKLTAKDL